MKISLFSQSLFALPLQEAISATAEIGFSAIELACAKPHFDSEIATKDPAKIAHLIRQNKLTVSALSLFNDFTNISNLDDQIQKAELFISLAPLFETKIIKMTPGPPGSLNAKDEHWDCLSSAIKRLIPIAEKFNVKLAFETHMRQLTDTLDGSKRLLNIADSETVGLTVDFSNLSFAGERIDEVILEIKEKIYNTHIKNGTVGEDGTWYFNALNNGLTDYNKVLKLLYQIGYDGYLTIECLSQSAKDKPIETAKADLDILLGYIKQTIC